MSRSTTAPGAANDANTGLSAAHDRRLSVEITLENERAMAAELKRRALIAPAHIQAIRDLGRNLKMRGANEALRTQALLYLATMFYIGTPVPAPLPDLVQKAVQAKFADVTITTGMTGLPGQDEAWYDTAVVKLTKASKPKAAAKRGTVPASRSVKATHRPAITPATVMPRKRDLQTAS